MYSKPHKTFTCVFKKILEYFKINSLSLSPILKVFMLEKVEHPHSGVIP